MGRRAFIRRLIAAGVSTAAALVYADVLEAMPADATVLDFYLFVQDFVFLGSPAALAAGQTGVEFGFASSNSVFHTATDKTGMGLFDTGYVRPGGIAHVNVPSAGSYPFRCVDQAHVKMTGKLTMPVDVSPASAPLGTTFTLTWAWQQPAGYVFDLQKKNPGVTTWSNWQTGLTSMSGTFKPSAKGKYKVRARLRRTATGKKSNWSPVRTFTAT